MQRKNGMTEFQALLASGKAGETLRKLEERFHEGEKLSEKESRLLASLQSWRSIRQERNERKLFPQKKTRSLGKEDPVEKAILRNHKKKSPKRKRFKPMIRRFK